MSKSRDNEPVNIVSSLQEATAITFFKDDANLKNLKRKGSSDENQNSSIDKKCKSDADTRSDDQLFLSVQEDLKRNNVAEFFSSFEEELEITVTSIIGSGTSGTVFKATWKDRVIAIKKIPYQENRAPSEEISSLQAVKQANIVNVINYLGHVINNKNSFIFTDYIAGQNLNNFIAHNQHSPLSWEEKYTLTGNLAAAIKGIHALNLLHGDIKSDNILITPTYNPVLCDFGLATSLPAKNHFRGTRIYMSPEMLRGLPLTLTEKSDIYSLGVVLYEIVVWGPSFAAHFQEHMHLFFHVVSGRKRGNFSAETPIKLAKLVRWCWQDESEKRPNATELCTELSTSLSEQSDKLTKLSLM